MASVRRITVGFQGANRSIKEISEEVPAEWIPESYTDALEVLNIPQVKRRISVTVAPMYVQVSEPYDDDPIARITAGL